jgi:hypothetical protein
MPRRDITARVTQLRDGDDEDLRAYAAMSPEERLAMMWQLSREGWALYYAADPARLPTDAESRFPRRVVRVRRRAR